MYFLVPKTEFICSTCIVRVGRVCIVYRYCVCSVSVGCTFKSGESNIWDEMFGGGGEGEYFTHQFGGYSPSPSFPKRGEKESSLSWLSEASLPPPPFTSMINVSNLLPFRILNLDETCRIGCVINLSIFNIISLEITKHVIKCWGLAEAAS